MTQPHITIQYTFPNNQSATVARLYYQAFQQKLAPIFRDDDKALALLTCAMNPDYAYVAMYDGNVVGVAGFKDSKGNLVDAKAEHFTDNFGFFGGWWRIFALMILDRELEDGILLMDGLAVDASMRGQGLGTKLLDAIIAHGKDNQYNSIRLDVVDTNPRAKQLYERKGFVATKTESYPFFERIFGFGGATTMLYPLDT